jgi:hypothetical protein
MVVKELQEMEIGLLHQLVIHQNMRGLHLLESKLSSDVLGVYMARATAQIEESRRLEQHRPIAQLEALQPAAACTFAPTAHQVSALRW